MAISKTLLKRAPAKKAASKASAKKPAAARKAVAKAAPKAAAATTPPKRKARAGLVSHTELASANPAATKLWCQQVLGWKFGDPMPIPGGEYHMWRHDEGSGGGIRANNPPEAPGTIPYVEVPDIKAAFAKATKAGAAVMMPPDMIPGTTDWIAIVCAPGGVPIGFWAPK